MDRWQLVVIVLVATGAWYLYKRFVKKERPWREGYRPPQPDVENWYAQTMATIDDMDESTKEAKETAWNAMTETEQLEFAQEFMSKRFGREAVTGYNRKQRLKIGMAQFIKSEPEEAQGESLDDAGAPSD